MSVVTGPSGDQIRYGHDGAFVASISTTGVVASEVHLAYDADHRVAATTLAAAGPGDTITYAFDGDGLLSRVGAMTNHRDPATGDVVEATIGLVAIQSALDGFGRLSTLSADFNGAPLYAASVRRDLADRVVEKVETLAGVTTTETYAYDADGRLIGVDFDGARHVDYAYDENSNRVSVDEDGVVHVGAYDAQDRVTMFDGATYTHAPTGELTTRTDADGRTTRFRYDVLGALRAVELSDGRVVEYAVDPLGRRIARTIAGEPSLRFVYALGLQPIAALDDAGNVTARFVFAGRTPAYMVKGGRTYGFITDMLGSVRLVVDVEDGAVAQRLDYDPWGRVLTDTAPGFQPFGFAGGLHDPDSGLVRFGVRDYDPRLGRWTAKDPLLFGGGDPNLYAYVANDPVNRVDPSGLSPSEDNISVLFHQILQQMSDAGDRLDIALPIGTGAVNNLVGTAMMLPWWLGFDVDPPAGCHGQAMSMTFRLRAMMAKKGWKFETRTNFPEDASPLAKYRPLSGYHWVVRVVSPSGEVFKLDPNNGVMGPWGPQDAQYRYHYD